MKSLNCKKCRRVELGGGGGGRNASRQCKSDQGEMPRTGDTRQDSQRKLATHYHRAGRVRGVVRVRLYIPRKKADKVGLTRSPPAEFFGFWSSRGPASPMMRAPTGAVRRMASTAIVSTSMPYFFSVSSSRLTAMSRAVEPIAACRTTGELRRCTSSPGGRREASTHTYLHGGFGHPRQGYEDFLSHAEAGAQDAGVGEQNPDSQGDEQSAYSHTCTHRFKIKSEK